MRLFPEGLDSRPEALPCLLPRPSTCGPSRGREADWPPSLNHGPRSAVAWNECRSTRRPPKAYSRGLGCHDTAANGIQRAVPDKTSLPLTFEIGVAVPGLGTFRLIAGAAWSQVSSSTHSNNSTWQAGTPGSASSGLCYNVFGQGGSQAAGTANIVGIYTWTATHYSTNNSYGLP